MLKFIQNFLDIKEKGMIVEIVKFNATDGIHLDGILYKCDSTSKKVLIQIHGMTSNCFKNRDKTIAEKVNEIGIDVLDFNNRGSDIVRYIKNDNVTLIAGMAYEKVEDCYFDVVGAIEFAIKLGYEEIYLQGHSLGSTKVVYTYNKLQKENSNLINNIKGIILLSLVDITGLIKSSANKELIKLAEQKAENGELMDLMPFKSFIHPISVKSFIQYTKHNEKFDFARYSIPYDNFEVLNSIKCPIFMRWGNVNELIKQDAKYLAEFMNKKITNPNKNILYIDGADHSYHGKNEQLAEEIKKFLGEINVEK